MKHDSSRPDGGPTRAPPAILLVDDDRANLLSFRATLEPLGYPLVSASSGEEALRQLLKRDFALILLDVQMPGMDGFEVAEVVKSHTRLAAIPIIFVTAISRDGANVFTGYARGAVDYLLKPFQPEMLRAKVNVFVELHKAQRTVAEQAQLLHEQELRDMERRNEERFVGLTESMPFPVWGVTSDGTVYACNQSWTEYSGLRAEETGSIANPSWVHPQDAGGLAAAWRDRGQPRAALLEMQARLRRQRDGAFRWHLLRAVPERGVRARQGFWTVVAVDIESQKVDERQRARMLEREQRAREEAEAANRMKDEFLATVSHELRTPLNAILGWSRLVRTRGLDSDSLGRAIETIERNAHVQARLINDILDTSRIISGKLRLQISEFDLHGIVADAIDTVRPGAETKGIVVGWEKSETECKVVGDPSRLQQIIWNLLSNAVKFTAKDGRVDVRVARDAEGLRVEVSDTGRGIDPQFLPHVFDRFRQQDATISREHQGLGLGLSIVKHLAELHGGRVVAESAGLGKGASFTVILPSPERTDLVVAGRDAVVLHLPSESERPRTPPPRLDGARVLFVDDQPEARELVSVVLGQQGATVTAVETAEQAIDACRASLPHVLITDIGLPGEDGYALIRRVRALESRSGGRVPAIALTAHARPEDENRARHEGFQVHMAKPVEADELVTLVASLVHAAKPTAGKVEAAPVTLST